jgi:hypothetical protein
LNQLKMKWMIQMQTVRLLIPPQANYMVVDDCSPEGTIPKVVLLNPHCWYCKSNSKEY